MADGGNKTMGGAEWAMLIALSALWGGSFFFNGVAVHGLPPLTIVVLRTGLGAVALWLFCRATGVRMPADRHIWLAFFVMGLLNNVVPFSLIVWGQTHIASGLAAILNATTPVFTVLVAHVLTADEKLTWNRLAGVVLGLAGVVVMIGPAALAGLGVAILAQIAVLGGALSYAFAGIFGRRFRAMGISPAVTALGQVTASTLMLAPIALFVDHPWTLVPPGLSVLGGRSWPGAVVDGARLHPLFPHSGECRRHQCPPGHAAGAGQRHHSRRPRAGRAARPAPLRRHGADCHRPCGNRRPPAAPTQAGLSQPELTNRVAPPAPCPKAPASGRRRMPPRPVRRVWH